MRCPLQTKRNQSTVITRQDISFNKSKIASFFNCIPIFSNFLIFLISYYPETSLSLKFRIEQKLQVLNFEK